MILHNVLGTSLLLCNKINDLMISRKNISITSFRVLKSPNKTKVP